MRNSWFPILKRGIFRPGKEIEGLSGGLRRYVAQASPKIDAARAEKDRFRMENRVTAINPAYSKLVRVYQRYKYKSPFYFPAKPVNDYYNFTCLPAYIFIIL
jgi:hypothetical protein